MIEIIILIIIALIFAIYALYFKEYFNVKKIYTHLRNFLDARDGLVLKLIPEIKNKEIASKIVCLIDERRVNFNTSYNNSILADIKLNEELRKLYDYINSMKKNDVVIDVFKKIIILEKDLKNIRKEYNVAVSKYNENLVKHKFMCLKVIKMKPLDTYKIKT